ncbi:MAG: hypothetical protein ACLQIH_15805 [Myxococcaceae bacterium]
MLAAFILLFTLPVAAADEADSLESAWNVRVAVNAYLFAHQSDYVQPTAAVDHGILHLEARYNYEAQRTGSLWVGWNFEWGKDLRFALTPMLGGIFGEVGGIAPGLEWDLSWGPLELYSETEFVFDFGNSSDSDFYTWSELSWSPFEWLRAGLALQRTRAFAASRVVQWGPFVGFKVWKLSANAYWFNPGQTNAQYWVLSLGGNF